MTFPQIGLTRLSIHAAVMQSHNDADESLLPSLIKIWWQQPVYPQLTWEYIVVVNEYPETSRKKSNQ
jgi:hypothetical protein